MKNAQIISEALPYIKKFHGKTIVIKYGGNAMIDEKLRRSFARDVALLKLVGINPIIIHGGGPQITEYLDKIGKKQKFINGLRVTDTETMEAVEMVLGGRINKEIVSLINQSGCKAVGLTGKDGFLIRAKKIECSMDQKIDLGWVGDVESIDPQIISIFEEKQIVPIIAPIGVDNKGQSYNINADTVAGKVASVIQSEKLIYLTNTSGVLDKNDNLLTGLRPKKVKDLIREGSIFDGMIPKLNSAIDAISCGVKNVHIIDGRVPNALLLEILTDKGIGTLIK